MQFCIRNKNMPKLTTTIQTSLWGRRIKTTTPSLLPNVTAERVQQLKEKYSLCVDYVELIEAAFKAEFWALSRWDRFPKIYDIDKERIISGELLDEGYDKDKKCLFAISNYPILGTKDVHHQLTAVYNEDGSYTLKIIPQNEISNKDATIFTYESIEKARELFELFYKDNE